MLARAAAALIAAAALAAPAVAAAAPRLEKVGDFAQPVHVTGAPGDFTRLYVTERQGTVQVVGGGQIRQFLDLRAAVSDSGGEEGLLSVAFPPDFLQSRLFYVYFTDTNGDNRVEELRAPTGDAADPASRRLVMLLEHPGASNHNGGQLQFGRDGMLYLAPGDGGSSNDPGNDAQRLDSELGKILRIDPRQSGSAPYTVPPGNPFAGRAGARPEIWSFGLRNPFRFSFDRLTGDLTIGDVGQGRTEEIDFVPASEGAGGGVNFGWSPCEGSYASGSTTTACPLAGARGPVIDHFQSQGWRAIIGGYVVRDATLPSLVGRYVYSDAVKGELWSASLAVPRAQDVRRSGPDVLGASSFGEDAAGCVYVTQLTGAVSRIVENDARIPCPDPTTAPGADTSAPRLRARVRRRQRVLRLRSAVAYARCSERCAVAAGGRLTIRQRRFAMKRVVTRLPRAGARKRIEVRLTRRGRRALRRALRRGTRASVKLKLRARDPAGNRSRLARRGVRVIRL